MDNSFSRNLIEKTRQLQRPKPYLWYPKDREWPPPILGCNLNEIEEIKVAQKVSKLPSIYEQFLLAMGKSSGDLYIGEDVHYHRLLLIKEFFNQELQTYKVSFSLPNDIFVFMSHHDVAFLYFLTESSDDPEIYVFEEPHESEPNTLRYRYEMVKTGEKLSHFLTQFIAERESEAAQKEFLQQFV